MSDRHIAEARWRQRVMTEARDALASGDASAANEALSRHEWSGYPWAPGAPSNRGPETAHDFLAARAKEADDA